MVKTPGQIMYESPGTTVPWSELSESTRRQFELEGAAVWNTALDAAIREARWVEQKLIYPVNVEALKVQP